MFKIDGIKVVSFFPGRVRLRIEKIEQEPGFGDKVQSSLEGIPGIKKLEVKESTSSVLVVYDKKKLKQPEASEQLMQQLHKLFPDLDVGRVKDLLGV